MANKRQIKKAINFACGDLFAECVAINHYRTNTTQEDVDNLMASVLRLQDDMICRVSHIEPGMKASEFFKKLRQDMISRIGEIVDQLNALT